MARLDLLRSKTTGVGVWRSMSRYRSSGTLIGLESLPSSFPSLCPTESLRIRPYTPPVSANYFVT